MPAVHTTEWILHELDELEKVEKFQILYACESGSRAWGFPSPDSDYDIRFVYLSEPSRYLKIESIKDHVDYPINGSLDISGWECIPFGCWIWP